MKKDIIRFIGVILIILVFSIFVYPTPFYYNIQGTEETSKTIVKINRFTGKAEALIPSGWFEMKEKK
jgi:PDZ domain-containing secreted protein